MAFNQKKLKGLSKSLNLSEENTITFLRRQSGFLKNNINQVFRSYSILIEIKENQVKDEVKSLKEKSRYRTKNLLIAKYMNEILNLFQKEGFGAKKISTHLKINHKADVSKSALESFFKANNITRNLEV